MGKRVVAVGAMKGRASGVTTIGLDVVKIVMVAIKMYHLTTHHPQSAVSITNQRSAVATGSQAIHGSTAQPAVAGGVGGTKTQSAVATGS